MSQETEQRLDVLVQETLQLDANWRSDDQPTLLLGYVAELDSMSAMKLLTAIEEQFGFAIREDSITGDLFESFESLLSFVQSNMQPS